MDVRADRSTASPVDPRTSLALWLRAGRAQRKLTLDDVARVTKIQTRILEKLEAGCFDGLPADVFVRGFVRSVARCVGLDEQEAIDRYGACAGLAPVARALVETMSELAPATARMIEEPVVMRVPAATPSMPAPVVVEAPVVEPIIEPIVEDVVEAAAPIVVEEAAPIVEAVDAAPAEMPAKKKRSRKKAAGTTPPRTRKKKSAEPLAEMTAEPVAVSETV
ncbi:MAG TPA: helix-turn-helix domain-containing protein, partial [Polyangiales bacterium]|nr:helix-turn-helix domain-containing protein [Polyangiales bacterium]